MLLCCFCLVFPYKKYNTGYHLRICLPLYNCFLPLQFSLSVLNVSGNNLTEVSELAVLSRMTQFFAANNKFDQLYDLSCAVRSWPAISRLELSGNPFCHKKKYRDKVILMSKRLGL